MMRAIRGCDLSLPMTRLRKTVGVDRPTRLNSFLPSLALLVSLFFAMEVVTAIPPQEAPEITHISFETWSSPGKPHILVALNQPVTQESLRRHLFFLVDGLEKLPVILEPAEEHPDLKDREWRIQPVVEMPPDTQVQLKAKPGVTPETVVEFYTFPTPRFLGIECSNNFGLLIRIYAPTSHSPSQGCNPLSRIYFVFSSPVTREMIRDHLVVEPGLKFGDSPKDSHKIPGLSPNSFLDKLARDTQLNRPRKQGQEYKILLPQSVKAATSYHLSARASEILDEFGRPLGSDIDFDLPTNNLPPDLVVNHPISILEGQTKTHLPVTVTNIGELDVKFQRLTGEGIERSQVTVAVDPRNLSSPPAHPSNIPYRFPLKVREWLRGQSGVLLGYFSTYPFTGPPRWFFSEVTPFHVDLKLSRDNSLVWVTDLETGRPVQGAQVRIYRDRVSAMTARPTPLSTGRTGVDGTALLDGLDLLDPELKNLDSWPSLDDREGPEELLFVRVDRSNEMALLPLADEFSVVAEVLNKNRMPTAIKRLSGAIHSWGTTAQGLYQTGDTVQFKLYVREQKDQSFKPAPARGYHLQVIDPMNKVTHQVKALKLNNFGAYDGEFKVPVRGALGWYRFELKADFLPDQSWKPMRMLVGPSYEARTYTRNATLRGTIRPMTRSSLRRSSMGKRTLLGGPGHHLPIEPEKTEYQVGETARILIRNPFPGARALFTVERLGVLQSWSRILESDTEFVEFEITSEHFPGVHFSATVMSPRSHQPLEKGEMGVSQPTVRMGYIGLAVRDPYKEITVEVRPRRSAYRPGERVNLDLAATPLHRVDRQEGLPNIELAVVVLDEAWFNRLARRREDFDPYKGFYSLQPLDLQNFNLLTPMIGMRRAEKKTSDTDGSVPRANLDPMFPFVGYWNPSLLTDANGRATIGFRVPKSLTSWRVLVMAVTSGNQMGFGEGHFTVHPATELLPPEPAAY